MTLPSLSLNTARPVRVGNAYGFRLPRARKQLRVPLRDAAGALRGAGKVSKLARGFDARC